MRLHFSGTKGYVEEKSRAHSGHSAFTVEREGFRLLCDFGQNRKGPQNMEYEMCTHDRKR